MQRDGQHNFSRYASIARDLVHRGASDHAREKGHEQLPDSTHTGARFVQNRVVSNGRIRKAMEEANPEPLKGEVEFDSTRHGGKAKGMGQGYVAKKTSIMGAIERGGPIRLRVQKRSVSKVKVHAFLKEHLGPDAHTIITDTDQIYRKMDFGDIQHSAVDHSKKEWVRGDVHTNSIESVWSLFKRGVVG
jgi:hypothetical protein